MEKNSTSRALLKSTARPRFRVKPLTREQIKKHFSNYNFMTPDRLRLGQRGKLIYEISTGTDFSHNPIYGVTVKILQDYDGNNARSSHEFFENPSDDVFSKCFQGKNAKQNAIEHVKQLDLIYNFFTSEVASA